MGNGRNWTASELEQLAEEWGRYSVPAIAEHLNRSVVAVKLKASRLSLGAHLYSSQYISLNILMKTLGISGGSYEVNRFTEAGLKIHMQKVNHSSFKMVDIEEFWNFADKNRHMIDFSRFEEGALGREPDWVKEKRCEDFKRAQCIKPHNTKWSREEDKELLRLVRAYHYTYSEISERMQRSEGAICRRLNDLGIKERPLKADNHNLWTEEQTNTLCQMIKESSNYENMSRAIGKSSKAIRGKVFSVYLTENLGKVRNAIKDGAWGDNRPPRRVHQRNLMTLEEKAEVKDSISTLAGLLAHKVRTHFDSLDNWQRNLCQNWDEIKGCTVGETDCDLCSSFVRLRPQYCARCGGSFLERRENRMCEKCRTQRKKLGYKKYLRNQAKTKRSLFN